MVLWILAHTNIFFNKIFKTGNLHQFTTQDSRIYMWLPSGNVTELLKMATLGKWANGKIHYFLLRHFQNSYVKNYQRLI